MNSNFKKKAVTILMVISILCISYCQDSYYGELSSKINSPNAASLIDFNNFPNDYYTGKMQVTIPLYNVKLDNVNLPIGLNYNSGGIKVNDEATWVGLGWSLNAGGMVKHIVNDLPLQFDNEALPINGNYDSYWNRELSDEEIKGYGISGTGIQGYNYDSDNDADSEADYIIFNFGNFSGKFLHIDGEFIEIKKSGLKLFRGDEFNLIDNKTELQRNASWTIVDLNGNTYVFSDIETVYSESPNFNESPSYTAYISLIKTSKGKLIEFAYTDYGRSNLIPVWQNTIQCGKSDFKFLQNVPGSCPGIVVCGQDQWFFVQNHYHYSIITESSELTVPNVRSTSYIDNKLYLSTIKWEGNELLFEPNLGERQDLQGLSLNKISLFNNYQNLVKAYSFDYAYFEGDERYGDLFWHVPENEIPENWRKKRLMLNAINVVGDNGASYMLNSFEYYDDELPYKTSAASDYWGYFNGSKTNTSLFSANHRFINKIVPQEVLSEFSNLTNKEPNEEFANAFSLKKIYHATGGNTNFEYGLNEYERTQYDNNVNFSNKVAFVEGGLQNTDELVINDYYGSSRVLFSVVLNCQDGACTPAQGSSDIDSEVCYIQLMDENDNLIRQIDILSCPYTYNGLTNSYEWEAYIELENGTYKLFANNPFGENGRAYAILRAKVYTEPSSILEGGGIRIEKKTISDGETSYNMLYEYEGGKLLLPPNMIRRYVLENNATMQSNLNTCCYPVFHQTDSIIEIQSSSFVPLAISQASVVGYGGVHEIKEGIVKNGETIYSFTNKYNNYGVTLYESLLSGIPICNNIDNGNLLGKSVYKYYDLEKQKVYSESIMYRTEIDRLYSYKTEFREHRNDIIPYLHVYPIMYGVSVPNRITTSEYTSNGTFSRSVATIYNENMLVSSKKVIDPIDESTISTTVIRYPTDFDEIPTGAPLNTMRNTNMLGSIIEQQLWKESGLVESTYFNYEFNSDIPLLKNTYKIHTDTPLELGQYVGIDDNGNKLPDSDYSLNISIDYDLVGNIINYSKVDDISTCYIYGYKNTLPILKVVGLNASELELNYGDEKAIIIQDSNLPITSDYNTIKLAVSNLKDALSNLYANNSIQIYLYTHKPLVGITSETAPNGQTTYYEYDGLGRLICTRNNEGHILQENKYHYAE